MRNMKVKDFLSQYITHDVRMFDVEFDTGKSILRMKLENVHWVQLEYERKGKQFTRLDLEFIEVADVKSTHPIEELDESILGIDEQKAEGFFTILVDDSKHTTVRFWAESVTVREFEDSGRREEIVNGN